MNEIRPENKRDKQKPDAGLKNQLKALRLRLGLSQQELAQAAGVARQTIGGIEASLYAPSAAVALRLARVLGCRVEEIFWLEDEPSPIIRARVAQLAPTALRPETPVLLGQVGEQWYAHPLEGDAAFRSELTPADGLLGSGGTPDEVSIELLDTPDALRRTVFVAGCSPAFSLWVRAAERWHPGLRIKWLYANSTRALEALRRGEIHLAGVHVCDPATGEINLPFVRRMVPDIKLVLVTLGVWDEGLIVAPGNPKRVRGVESLAQGNIRFLNRETGAGARFLLDDLLREARVPAGQILGYEQSVGSYQSVARSVRQGLADAGLGTAAMARIYGLDFVPLRSVRFDLVLRAEYLSYEPVAQLLETLTHRQVRTQLERAGGYDTRRTGERYEC